MLPISVAFIVGGYSGSLLGQEDFFWAGAILWSTIIAIIDYNFTIIKHGLGFLGTTGRIVLILTSAVITSTVGDHIILEDTIKRAKVEHFEKQKTTIMERNNELILAKDKLIEIAKDDVEKQKSITDDLRIQEVEECRDWPGPRCKFMNGKVLKAEELLKLKNDGLEKRLTDKANFIAEKEKEIDEIAKRHDIVLEMKLLYGEIFKETITTIMFFMFALMVICIETLPLLLKSGITGGEATKQQERDNANAVKKQRSEHSIILRNNRI